MTVKTGDTVVLKDGKREKSFVVIGFTKFHVNLAPLSSYADSMKKFGEYRTMVYGYASWNIKSSAIQKGFWALLHSVNGIAGTK